MSESIYLTDYQASSESTSLSSPTMPDEEPESTSGFVPPEDFSSTEPLVLASSPPEPSAEILAQTESAIEQRYAGFSPSYFDTLETF